MRGFRVGKKRKSGLLFLQLSTGSPCGIRLSILTPCTHWDTERVQILCLYLLVLSLSLLTLFTASWSLHTMHATGLKLLLRCSLISLPIHLLSLLWLYSQRSLLLHVCLFCPCPHCFIFFTVFICRLFAEVNVFDSSLCLVIICNLC